MTAANVFYATALFVLLPHHGFALDILAIVSLPLHSHYMAFSTLFRELAVRGHHVTVINNFHDQHAPPNLRFVDIQFERFNGTPTLEFYEQLDRNYVHYYNMYRHISLGQRNVRLDCGHLFNSANVKAHLAEGRKYDVIFVEQFMSDCALAYALALYDAPIIGISSHVMLPFAYPRLGIPFDVAADQFYFSKAGPNPSLFEKLETFLFLKFITGIGRWALHRHIYAAFDHHLPNHSLDIERDAKARMKMMFSYQHHSVCGARLLAPQLLEIGGVHIGVPKTVPKDVEDFLADAKHGAIYVSFGSNLKAGTMSKRRLEQFLTAFRRLPQKVIWKFENVTFTEKKILTRDWFPQLDILCHPKVLAFISHGGMLSLSESAHCGKPLLTMPFFGDQFSNSAALRAVGMGVTLYFDRLDENNLEAAVKEITSDKMQQNAKRISKLWHDRPMPVMDSAIYWTEYVARHKTAPPALPSKNNSWYDSLLIDVAVVILALVAILVFLVYLILWFIKYVLIRILGLFFTFKMKEE